MITSITVSIFASKENFVFYICFFLGPHLNSQKETIDLELEKKNFKHAGETLAKIWNNVSFCGHKIKAEYFDPDDCTEAEVSEHDPEWLSTHVQVSK